MNFSESEEEEEEEEIDLSHHFIRHSDPDSSDHQLAQQREGKRASPRAADGRTDDSLFIVADQSNFS